MPSSVDLHTHSTASDGTLTPTELVTRAHANGVRLLALTDHDSTRGVAEARLAADRCGLTLLPGVEVSVTWGNQVVHVVGLGMDCDCQRLQQGLAGLRRYRAWRAEEIGRRLEKAGIPGAYQGAKALSSGDLIGRTHFARFLVARGHAAGMRKVFQHYLTRGKPGYVPGEWAELADAVGWIREAGGQAVIAHPARYPMSRGKLRRLIGEFKEAGGVALEVVSGSHSRDDNLKIGRHARDFQLEGSSGSDYHGPENPWVELGRLPPLPDAVVPLWARWEESQLAQSA